MLRWTSPRTNAEGGYQDRAGRFCPFVCDAQWDELWEKVTFVQRPWEVRNSHAASWGKSVLGADQQVQKPWGRSVLDLFQEQQGGERGWSWVSEEEGKKWYGQRGKRETLANRVAFTLHEIGAMGGFWAGEGYSLIYGEGNGNPLQYSCLENPMTEEPGRLQSMGSQRVRHNLATKPPPPCNLNPSQNLSKSFFVFKNLTSWF